MVIFSLKYAEIIYRVHWAKVISKIAHACYTYI